jgi:hypothetical protein
MKDQPTHMAHHVQGQSRIRSNLFVVIRPFVCAFIDWLTHTEEDTQLATHKISNVATHYKPQGHPRPLRLTSHFVSEPPVA